MQPLRELFLSLGYTEVRTFIASGNVIFATAERDQEKLERRIEGALAAALGFEVATFVRPMSEVREISPREPFPRIELQTEGNALYIGFLKADPPAAAKDAILSLGSMIDEFRIEGSELYWLCRKKISDSPVSGALIEKKLGSPMTLRNATTVRKIAALGTP